MNLLLRYILKNNIKYVLTILSIGCIIYLLADLFDSIDNFLENNVSVKTILLYYCLKLPFIIAQILPAVFLLATTVQFALMEKNRELVALQAGGVSPAILLGILLACGLLWGSIQFFFAQQVGVKTEREVRHMWQYVVKGKQQIIPTIENVWFMNKSYVIKIGVLYPTEERGENVEIYNRGKDISVMTEIYRADSFQAKDGIWTMHNVHYYQPESYGYTFYPEHELTIKRDLKAFLLVQGNPIPDHYSVSELKGIVKELRKAGANVEILATGWHKKMSYAASLLVMCFMTLVITSFSKNIYICVSLSLAFTFIFFVFFTIGTTMGEKGVLSPVAGAWFANAVFMVACLLRLVSYYQRK